MLTLTFPRSSVKELTDAFVRIEISEEIFEQSYGDVPIFRETYGLLKNRKKELINYLENSRKEWDERDSKHAPISH